MERSGTGRVGGLCLFGPASAAAEVVNSVSDLSSPPAVRARLGTGAGRGCSGGEEFPLRGEGGETGREERDRHRNPETPELNQQFEHFGFSLRKKVWRSKSNQTDLRLNTVFSV